MGKGWVFIILLIVIVGAFFYFKPVKTKDTFKDGSDYVGSIVKDKWDSREQNLGQPTLPCTDDENCNENILECEDKCICVSGECIKNVPDNPT